jgi:hypothetical protein
MSTIYQDKIHKHSTYLQKIIEESGKSDNPDIINMSKNNLKKINKFLVNNLSNSVIKDFDNLRAIIKKPTDFSLRKKTDINDRYDNEINEENFELVNDISFNKQNEIKRNLSDYVKKYKPASKVKKINDYKKDIEIYFSEKTEKDFFTTENGKLFQEDEFVTNFNFERNFSKAKFKTMMIVRFLFQIIFIIFN